MQIQLNTDHHIPAREAFTVQVKNTVNSALSRFSEHITRVEIHLSDENGNKSGPDDKRCVMEVRLEGRQPIAVTYQGASRDEAINGAMDKLARLVEHTLARAAHIERSKH
jgi:ribosome-associated translation inhibitor RaiA